MRPWYSHPKLAKQHAKRRRIITKGFAPAGDKASLRQMADAAALSHPIRKLKPGPRPDTAPRGSLYQRAKDLMS